MKKFFIPLLLVVILVVTSCSMFGAGDEPEIVGSIKFSEGAADSFGAALPDLYIPRFRAKANVSMIQITPFIKNEDGKYEQWYFTLDFINLSSETFAIDFMYYNTEDEKLHEWKSVDLSFSDVNATVTPIDTEKANVTFPKGEIEDITPTTNCGTGTATLEWKEPETFTNLLIPSPEQRDSQDFR